MKCTLDDFVFDNDPDLKLEEFCQDWLEDEKENFITCHKDDFKRMEEENIRIAAELKRLKAKIYSFAVSDGIITLSVTSSAI